MDSLATLLESCTVRLTAGPSCGTGFFVAPGLVLTCAHVVQRKELGAKSVTVEWNGQAQSGEVIHLLPDPCPPPPTEVYPDLALIRVDAQTDHSCVFLNDVYRLSDPLYVYGFPVGRRGGDSVTPEVEGHAQQGDASADLQLLKLKSGQIRPGHSGAPILNRKTGGVCGMVKVTRNKDTDLGGLGVRVGTILTHFKFLIDAQKKKHGEWSDWLDQLDADQCVEGGACMPDPGESPYRGLFAFEEQHHDIFFGRKTYTEKLLAKVETSSFVAVIGASGSGKSSLVQAGLFPVLRRKGWRVVVCRPQRRPFFSLAEALLKADLMGLHKTVTAEAVRSLAADLMRGKIRLRDLVFPPGQEDVRREAAESKPPSRGVVLVDQFEELYTMRAPRRARRFLDWLLDISQSSQDGNSHVTFVITLRADFVVSVLTNRRFADALEGSDLKLGPMTKDELREALIRPAQVRRMRLEDGLAERILDAVSDKPGHLPLLEFAMERLWERKNGRRMTHAAYEKIGGIEQALARYASSVLEPMNRRQQDGVRRVLLQLVRPGTEETGHTRRTATRSEIGECDWRLIVQLADLRLVVTGRTFTGGSPDVSDPPWDKVELVHEALIHHWPALRDWIDNDQDFLRWRDRIRQISAEWQRGESATLRGAGLREARRWVAERAAELGEVELRLIRASVRASCWRLAGGVTLAVVLLLAFGGGYEAYNASKVSALVDSLATAETKDVPRLVEQLAEYHRLPYPRLIALANRAKEGSKEQLHAALALLPMDSRQVEPLFKRMLGASPTELPVIIHALKNHQVELVHRLWGVLEDPQADSGQRFHAACALASYDPAGSHSKWDAASQFVTERLLMSVIDNPSYYDPLIDLLRPVRHRLITPLSSTFRDKEKRGPERSFAINILTNYLGDRPGDLADLLMDTDPQQFSVVFPGVRGPKALASLESELAKKSSSEAKDSEKDQLARRQANASVALIRLGEPEKAWPLLRHSPDPSARSYIVNWLKPLRADPKVLMEKMASMGMAPEATPVGVQSKMDAILFHPETSMRRALILALGQYSTEWLTPGDREPLMQKLLDLYETDPDAGIHGAAEWTLRQWGEQDRLKERDDELMKVKDWGKRRWYYVKGQGQTFAVIDGPVKFDMGSPPTEPERRAEELLHKRTIPRRFAIATKEVTVAQFRKFQQASPDDNNDATAMDLKTCSPDPSGPMIGVTWYRAAAYCNWLSRNESLPECYEPNDQGKFAEGMRIKADALKLTGYRLPTETEREYAGRAGAVTSRYYGRSTELLGKYAWYKQNSENRAWPCGRLQPNDLGLFDMLGNVYEWCHGRGENYRQVYIIIDIYGYEILEKGQHRILRGGSFYDLPAYIRSAYRNGPMPERRLTDFGFRPARTCP